MNRTRPAAALSSTCSSSGGGTSLSSTTLQNRAYEMMRQKQQRQQHQQQPSQQQQQQRQFQFQSQQRQGLQQQKPQHTPPLQAKALQLMHHEQRQQQQQRQELKRQLKHQQDVDEYMEKVMESALLRHLLQGGGGKNTTTTTTATSDAAFLLDDNDDEHDNDNINSNSHYHHNDVDDEDFTTAVEESLDITPPRPHRRPPTSTTIITTEKAPCDDVHGTAWQENEQRRIESSLLGHHRHHELEAEKYSNEEEEDDEYDDDNYDERNLRLIATASTMPDEEEAETEAEEEAVTRDDGDDNSGLVWVPAYNTDDSPHSAINYDAQGRAYNPSLTRRPLQRRPSSIPGSSMSDADVDEHQSEKKEKGKESYYPPSSTGRVRVEAPPSQQQPPSSSLYSSQRKDKHQKPYQNIASHVAQGRTANSSPTMPLRQRKRPHPVEVSSVARGRTRAVSDDEEEEEEKEKEDYPFRVVAEEPLSPSFYSNRNNNVQPYQKVATHGQRTANASGTMVQPLRRLPPPHHRPIESSVTGSSVIVSDAAVHEQEKEKEEQGMEAKDFPSTTRVVVEEEQPSSSSVYSIHRNEKFQREEEQENEANGQLSRVVVDDDPPPPSSSSSSSSPVYSMNRNDKFQPYAQESTANLCATIALLQQRQPHPIQSSLAGGSTIVMSNVAVSELVEEEERGKELYDHSSIGVVKEPPPPSVYRKAKLQKFQKVTVQAQQQQQEEVTSNAIMPLRRRPDPVDFSLEESSIVESDVADHELEEEHGKKGHPVRVVVEEEPPPSRPPPSAYSLHRNGNRQPYQKVAAHGQGTVKDSGTMIPLRRPPPHPAESSVAGSSVVVSDAAVHWSSSSAVDERKEDIEEPPPSSLYSLNLKDRLHQYQKVASHGQGTGNAFATIPVRRRPQVESSVAGSSVVVSDAAVHEEAEEEEENRKEADDHPPTTRVVRESPPPVPLSAYSSQRNDKRQQYKKVLKMSRINQVPSSERLADGVVVLPKKATTKQQQDPQGELSLSGPAQSQHHHHDRQQSQEQQNTRQQKQQRQPQPQDPQGELCLSGHGQSQHHHHDRQQSQSKSQEQQDTRQQKQQRQPQPQPQLLQKGKYEEGSSNGRSSETLEDEKEDDQIRWLPNALHVDKNNSNHDFDDGDYYKSNSGNHGKNSPSNNANNANNDNNDNNNNKVHSQRLPPSPSVPSPSPIKASPFREAARLAARQQQQEQQQRRKQLQQQQQQQQQIDPRLSQSKSHNEDEEDYFHFGNNTSCSTRSSPSSRRPSPGGHGARLIGNQQQQPQQVQPSPSHHPQPQQNDNENGSISSSSHFDYHKALRKRDFRPKQSSKSPSRSIKHHDNIAPLPSVPDTPSRFGDSTATSTGTSAMGQSNWYDYDTTSTPTNPKNHRSTAVVSPETPNSRLENKIGSLSQDTPSRLGGDAATITTTGDTSMGNSTWFDANYDTAPDNTKKVVSRETKLSLFLDDETLADKRVCRDIIQDLLKRRDYLQVVEIRRMANRAGYRVLDGEAGYDFTTRRVASTVTLSSLQEQQELCELIKAVCSLPNLRKLSLWSIQEKDLFDIGALITNHPTMSIFQLGLVSGTVDGMALRALATIPNLNQVDLHIHESFSFRLLLKCQRLRRVSVARPATGAGRTPLHDQKPFVFATKHIYELSKMLGSNRTRLTHLDLGPNISTEDFACLAGALQDNHRLKTLQVSFTGTTEEVDDCIEDVAIMLEYNTALHVLNNHLASSVKVGSRQASRLLRGLDKNETLRSLSLFDESTLFILRKDLILIRNAKAAETEEHQGPGGFYGSNFVSYIPTAPGGLDTKACSFLSPANCHPSSKTMKAMDERTRAVRAKLVGSIKKLVS